MPTSWIVQVCIALVALGSGAIATTKALGLGQRTYDLMRFERVYFESRPADVRGSTVPLTSWYRPLLSHDDSGDGTPAVITNGTAGDGYNLIVFVGGDCESCREVIRLVDERWRTSAARASLRALIALKDASAAAEMKDLLQGVSHDIDVAVIRDVERFAAMSGVSAVPMTMLFDRSEAGLATIAGVPSPIALDTLARLLADAVTDTSATRATFVELNAVQRLLDAPEQPELQTLDSKS